MILKFRAWLKEPRIMQYSDKLSSFFKDYENTNVPIMQFTGMHDCKRKEIFEGDIIRKETCSPDDPAYGHYGMIGNVGFEMGRFIVYWEDGTNEYLGEVEESIIEVIGNI